MGSAEGLRSRSTWGGEPSSRHFLLGTFSISVAVGEPSPFARQSLSSLAAASGVKPHIMQLTSGSTFFFFFLWKRKTTSERWVLAASSGFGSVSEVSPGCCGNAVSSSPVFQTGPVLQPSVACGLALASSSAWWQCQDVCTASALPVAMQKGSLWDSEESENSPEAYHSLSFCFRSFLLPVKSFYSTFSLLFFFPEMHYLAGARVLRISLFLWCLVLCFNSLDSSSSLLTSHPSWSTGR